MKIIIVGCGKVGLTVAEQLLGENHDLVLIDANLSRLQSIPEELDALRIHGNGASIGTLMEADIEHADLMIAVTSSDELNLLCCLIAKKAGNNCHTIARVRNPIYSEELAFLKEKLGISMIINPEYAAAMEIARLLIFPSAIQIDTFVKSHVELLRFRLRPEFGLDNTKLMDFSAKVGCDILICAVERGKEVIIPGGSFTLHDNDTLSILASPVNAVKFFRHIGLSTARLRNTLIVGGGKVAYYLANRLQRAKMSVRIVERSRERCEELADLLPNCTIICGDGTDRQLLMEEGLANAQSFITLTGMDEENILLTLFAKNHTNAKLITKVNRIAFTDIIENLDIGSVIYPKNIAAEYILQFVRGLHNSMDSNVETLYQILEGRAEAMEFVVNEKSAVTDIPLAQLNRKSSVLIGCIHRQGKVIIPRGNDTIQVGDSVIIVTTEKGLNNLEDILNKSRAKRQ